jgi:HptB-dependent secretion and biofilm anti anti-sigma factor
MKIDVHVREGVARIALNGRFDFSSHRDFRGSYDALLTDGTVQSIDVDLGGVEYLDSAALGMLLLLRERCLSANKPLALCNCRGMVAQVLEVANFGKLFTMK